ncbi:hypothetical protein JAAARDRAFT_53058 [Jaapia argillacea MUCL 33604]|uniref:Ribosome assembly protein 3 n=1 Tax=Jaapia argillacea MUCL 33604 TaxID=933084 RepID=A0A067QNM0_9AGAM|nr:hypothetical protein JAAARDRAFT_53058 [Jaapia argillacea MUCL 33604]
MAPPPSKPPTARKRNRKRRRRAASSSSSSSSSSSDASSDEASSKRPVPVKQVIRPSPESSDSSSSSSESDSDEETPARPQNVSESAPVTDQTRGKPNARRRSPSASPPPATIPSFIPDKEDILTGPTSPNEQVLKERFRKFWMASVADGFRDDLEEIRKEPNMTTSRLALLIDSLASGADVFASSEEMRETNEMEVVLEHS